MTAIVQNLIDPSAAPLYGTAALAARMVSPLFTCREKILTAQLGSSCLFAASYAVMDQRTATSVCLIGAIQTTVTLIAGDRAWLNRMGYVFLPVVLVLGAVTYSGLPTLLAVTACCLMMIGRLQQDLMRMRGIQLASGPFGAAHDALVGAWPALFGALLSFAIASIAFRRELKRSAAT